MKKIFTKAVLLMALACSANTAHAQLSDILSNVASKVQSSSNGSSNVLSALGNIITSKLIPTSSQIVGTWAYQEPAVMFTSSNALKSTASSVITKQIENKLQTYLDKAGIKKGNMSITFESDKTFYVSKGGKKVATGTYTMSNSEVSLTFKGRKTPCKMTPQLDNGTLVVVTDLTKLKTFLEGIGSNVSQLSTLTSLMKSMDGMKVGIRLSKQ